MVEFNQDSLGSLRDGRIFSPLYSLGAALTLLIDIEVEQFIVRRHCLGNGEKIEILIFCVSPIPIPRDCFRNEKQNLLIDLNINELSKSMHPEPRLLGFHFLQ